MTTFAVCTALYEAARPFLPAYLAGLRMAAQGEALSLVLAIDDFDGPDSFLEEVRKICPVVAVQAPAGASPARVRRCLLLEAVASQADVLIFADIDDVLAPGAPGLHAAALNGADISYGDLRLIDARGEEIGARFFDHADVPWRLAAADGIRDRNFLGLSNTAIRRCAIPDSALAIPDTVVAADWWFFTTLLLAGCTAQRVPGNVADYRIYGANELGAGAPTSRAELRHMIDVALRHYRAFPGVPELALCRVRIEALADEVAGWSSHDLAVALSASSARPGVWFECLDRLAHAPVPTADRHAVA